jgi:hypothetical protein
LPGVRHLPYREAPELTLTTVATFINSLLLNHREGEFGNYSRAAT